MADIRPVPSVAEMLGVAEHLGIEDLELAYMNYKRHYDVFFNIEHYDQQREDLINELKRVGLIEVVDGDHYLKEITVTEAIKIHEAATA